MNFMKRFIETFVFVCLLSLQSIAQQISFPKEVLQPCPGDYVGVSFADSPKELSVLSAILSYILSHKVTCNHVDNTSVIAIGDSIHTERTASFIFADTVNYDIKKRDALRSGEYISILTDGDAHKVQVALSVSLFSESIVKGKKTLMDNYSLSLKMQTDEAIWLYMIDENNPHGVSYYVRLNEEHCSKGDKVHYSYQELSSHYPVSHLVYLGDCVVFSREALKYNFAGAWNQMVCEGLLKLGYNGDMENGIYGKNENVSEKIERRKTPVSSLQYDNVCFSLMCHLD